MANRGGSRWWVALAALLVVVSASTDAQQPAVPRRLVSTSPSITETLFALGLGDRVVGVSNYCRFPQSVRTLPKVGTFLKPNAELIARLKPDLAFVHTGPNTTAAQLNALGIKTARIEAGSLSAVFSTIRDIGAAAGAADRADALLAQMNARLQRAKAAVASRTPRKVLIVVGRRTGTLSDIVGVGRGSYLSDIAALAGGVNVLETGTQYPRISMETIITLEPDVIIDVGEMGESPADSDHRRKVTETLWAGQQLVGAARNGNVRVTTDDAFVVPGPRMVDVTELMASWFHGVHLQ